MGILTRNFSLIIFRKKLLMESAKKRVNFIWKVGLKDMSKGGELLSFFGGVFRKHFN